MHENVSLWLYGLVAFLLSLMGVTFLAVVMLRLRSQQIRKEREYLRRLEAEQEVTLVRAATDVHDALKPLVSLVAMSLKEINREVSGSQRKLILECLEMVEVLSSEMNLSCLFLDARNGAELGFMASMARMVNWVNNLKPIKCVMSVDGDWMVSDAAFSCIVYRIAMEAIQNVIKHAEASVLTLEFTRTGPEFTMCIRDNGKGFERGVGWRGAGFGFRNMRQRAQMLPGRLSIDSEPGRGTSISLSWNAGQVALARGRSTKKAADKGALPVKVG